MCFIFNLRFCILEKIEVLDIDTYIYDPIPRNDLLEYIV